MADKRPKKIIYTTDKGTFVFPKLEAPDHKFKAEGEYSVKVRMSLNAAQRLIGLLDPIYVEAIREGEQAFKALDKAKQKKTPFKANPLFEEVLDEEGNETGDVAFKFAMAASGKDKKTGKEWTRKPVIFNAKGEALAKPPAIWGGTVGKVSFSAAPYFIPGTCVAGLKLRLEAAQIIELRSGGQRDAAGYGFGAEEGGYEGVGAEDEAASDTPASQGDKPAAGGDDEPF